MIIGIDLGTTNSVAAYLTDGGPKLIPNALGEVLTPSVVGVDLNGNVVVGRTAKELQVVHPDRCAATFKRCMGTDWKCQLDGKDFTPEKLSALVLKSLKADAEALFGHPVDRAVITVPAYFNDHQRKATLNAGRIAGFEVKRIINEPTAAAIAYGFHEANVESLLAVIDLGGGTFDVSIIEKFEGSLEVRASSGESFLGGEDFTRSICARLLESKGMHLEQAEMESPHLVSRLLHQCERAKCGLTRELTTEIRFPNAKGELSADSETTSIHREQLIQWCEPILARIELPIRRALGDACIRPHDLHEVILVGGATRMPMVAVRVEELLEKTPVCRLKTDEVVAMGEAIVGVMLDGKK
jgi:molecular chaperone HscC